MCDGELIACTDNHHHEIQDMSYAGLLLLRAFSMAQHAVIDGKVCEVPHSPWTVIERIVADSSVVITAHISVRAYTRTHTTYPRTFTQDPDTNIGTTTLIGGICLQLLVDSVETGEPCRYVVVMVCVGLKKQCLMLALVVDLLSVFGVLLSCSSWAFVFASVGDCKAFHYSVGSDKVRRVVLLLFSPSCTY